jgi:DNA repair protein RAD57
MTDLLNILPNFPTKSYTHLLPNLEKSFITVSDLLTLDALEIAKKAHLPVLDVRRLAKHVLEALQGNLGLGRDSSKDGEDENGKEEGNAGNTSSIEGELRCTGLDVLKRQNSISTLDEKLDGVLGGGVHTGCITEFVGER